jgi:hypothetical protein
MKKIVAAYIFSLGGNPAYSGNDKTMYITDPHKYTPVESIESACYRNFGFHLPFKLKTN